MRRLKQARQNRNMRLTDAALSLGVSQPTLSAWESERKSPPLDMLVRAAELYGVTTDYLLGRDVELNTDHTVPIPTEILPTLDSKPVWVPKLGWALVNAPNKCLIFADGSQISFAKVKVQKLSPELFEESPAITSIPIIFNALASHNKIWIEPISKDSELRQSLRGRYQIKNGFAENDCGNKFSFSTYGATWLAFEINE